jgi:hydroxyethylthiazole kinase-like uncharacterized protein yjeF
MQPLLSALQMRQADRFTIDRLGIPEIVLMEHAALAVVKTLVSRFGSLEDTSGLVIAGVGNNGGDALAAARLLHHHHCRQLVIVVVGDEANFSASCRVQMSIVRQLGLNVQKELTTDLVENTDWIVDGLFGTGLTRPVEGHYREAIERVNQATAQKPHWTVAIDIPSGLSADTGRPLGVALKASATVTLGFVKRGLVTGVAADYVGALHLDPIQIPRQIPGMGPDTFLFDAPDARAVLPRRHAAGHKGTYGHAYVWAGNPEKQGATAMSALAALKAGAGLVTVVGEAPNVDSIRPRLVPEIMSRTMGEDSFSQFPVLAIGPGMGIGNTQWATLVRALQEAPTLVLDADALNLLAEHAPESTELMKRRVGVSILTPHPKEAARLLNGSVDEVENDRFTAVHKLAERWNAWVLLKGKGTLIASAQGATFVVTTGNSALSKGGSGDLLTGIITSLLAQGSGPAHAACLGAYLHGRAAELASQKFGTERSVLASELAEFLPRAIHEVETCR